MKVFFLCEIGKAIPWADELTIVTSINTISHRCTKFFRNDAIELYGEIGDALPCIDNTISDNRTRWARGNASFAFATFVPGLVLSRQKDDNLTFRLPFLSFHRVFSIGCELICDSHVQEHIGLYRLESDQTSSKRIVLVEAGSSSVH